MQKKTAQENLQHPVADAVFFVHKSAKNTEKIKILYIGKRMGEEESEKKKKKEEESVRLLAG